MNTTYNNKDNNIQLSEAQKPKIIKQANINDFQDSFFNSNKTAIKFVKFLKIFSIKIDVNIIITHL